MAASYAIITCADNSVTTVTARCHIFDPAQNGSTGNAKI
jgi:hypothetical protein